MLILVTLPQDAAWMTIKKILQIFILNSKIWKYEASSNFTHILFYTYKSTIVITIHKGYSRKLNL